MPTVYVVCLECQHPETLPIGESQGAFSHTCSRKDCLCVMQIEPLDIVTENRMQIYEIRKKKDLPEAPAPAQTYDCYC